MRALAALLAQDGNEQDVVEKMLLIEWMANNYKEFGAILEIVTDRSQEGSQFCRGFGGIGGELRPLVLALPTPTQIRTTIQTRAPFTLPRFHARASFGRVALRAGLLRYQVDLQALDVEDDFEVELDDYF